MSISVPCIYGSISTSSIDPLVYLNFSVTMSYNHCSFLFFIFSIVVLCACDIHGRLYMYVCLFADMSGGGVHVQWCACMSGPKVGIEIHLQLLFHIIHWVMVSSAWQNLLVGLVLIASLLWGSIPPPSKTEITGGRYALLACKWVLRLWTLILILEPWVL